MFIQVSFKIRDDSVNEKRKRKRKRKRFNCYFFQKS